MSPTNLSPLANHLWQSTLCVGAAWLLALALKKNRPGVRYWLWLTASVKFLVPFSLLVSVGAHVSWRPVSPATPPEFSDVLNAIGRPFGPAVGVPSLAITPTGVINLPTILIAVWLCGIAVGLIFWLSWFRQMRAVMRTATPLALNLPIPVLSSAARLEPGVFGIRRPALILPAGITDRLTPGQLEAVLGHELCHVRRMDNLTGAIHMLVESIFWFHPLVWWIRTQLVSERERACDEEVVRQFRNPLAYAEAILNVCKLYTELPLVCVSGITGASLKRRIETIVAGQTGADLSPVKKLLLASATLLVVIGPLIIGIGQSPTLRAQSGTGSASHLEFEVASVKLVNHPVPVHPYRLDISHGIMTIDAIPLRFIIGLAYAAQMERVQGGPGWIDDERYDIQAKAGNPNATRDEVRGMLQNLLADRFRLAFHNETKQMPVYTLVPGKSGPKLKPAKDDEQTGITRSGGDRDLIVTFQKWPIAGLANTLSGIVGRPVRDQTGLVGNYDFKLEWSPDLSADSGLSIFTAVQEQLGLRLEAGKGPVEVMVIDRVEHPTPN